MEVINYSKQKHSHNFAIWAAARATQRAFTSTENLKKAFESTDIEKFVNDPENYSDFDELHKQWCNNICDHLGKLQVDEATYGRAAKLVNTYLKSRVVLKDLESEEAYYIHPPIDRTLLQNLAGSDNLDKDTKKWLRNMNWTQLDEKEYFELINFLRDFIGEKPFWMIEQHWSPVS